MELLAPVVDSGNRVETVAPVEAKQAEHWQIDAHAQTDRLVHLEGIVFAFVNPTLTSLHKSQHIDSGRRVQRNRVAQLGG